MGVALLVGILAVALAAALQLRRQAEHVMRQRAENQAFSLAEHAAQALAAADFILQTVQQEVTASGARDAAGFNRRFGSRQQNLSLMFRKGRFEPIELVVMADADGNMVSYSGDGPTPRIAVGDREYFRAAQSGSAGAVQVSGPVRSRVTGHQDFFLSRRLQAADGRFLGIVAAGVSTDYFTQMYDRLRVGQGDGGADGMSSISLLRGDLAVLARAPATAQPGEIDPRGALLAASAPPYSRHGGAPSPAIEVASRNVPGFPALVAVTIDEALYLAPWRRQAMLIAAMAAVAMLGFAYIFAVLVRVLRRREEFTLENQRLRLSAEAASRVKSQFLATVSHEIRTPMNGIIGTAELLAGRPLPDEERRLAAMLLRSGRNLLGMLNDVLDFSKIEAGELRIVAEPLDPRAVLRDVDDLFHAFATTKGLAMESEVDAAVPARVFGDAVRIRQVLGNLVGNAVKFTDTGFVALRAGVRTDASGRDWLRFEVEDSGVGIPAEAHERVFDVFAQADNAVERRFGGSGLGLAISKRLAQLMAGSLDFADRTSGGTCFHFDIPLVAAPGAAEPPAAEADAAARAAARALPPLHVLVTEDNPVNAMVVEAQLASLGCTCDVAVDGEDALAHLTHQRYDAVLMDCMLPGMSGYEAARQWREREARSSPGHLPIVALTANALASNAEQARAAGMDDFLTKPCTMDDLREALLRATEGRPSAAIVAPSASTAGQR